MKTRSRITSVAVLFGVIAFIVPTRLPAEAKGNVADFKGTEIVAYTGAPLDPATNAIWCDVSSLAWNEAMALLKGPLVFDPSLATADLLNRQDYTKADLDEASYVALAGYGEPIKKEIAAALKKKFGAETKSEIVPSLPPLKPREFLAFAYLYKNLEFPRVFAVNTPLTFSGKAVADFGFNRGKDSSRPPPGMIEGVRVLSYTSDNDFVIQLRTKQPGDQLLLAKVAPGKSLQETVASVLARSNFDSDWGLDKEDTLAIPKIDFDLLTEFGEFANKTTTSGVTIEKFMEKVRFRLNEKGALLKAEAVIMGLAMAMPGPRPQPKLLVFDQPFLVLLKRESSPRPYFAMWVGNSSLLVAP